MLIRGKAQVTKDFTWELNLKNEVKVTPSIQLNLSRGSMELLRVRMRMGVRLCKLREEYSDDEF